jgi:hypothetical protein
MRTNQLRRRQNRRRDPWFWPDGATLANFRAIARSFPIAEPLGARLVHRLDIDLGSCCIAKPCRVHAARGFCRREVKKIYLG